MKTMPMIEISIISMTPMIGALNADRLIASALISSISTTIQHEPAAFMPPTSEEKARTAAFRGRSSPERGALSAKRLYSLSQCRMIGCLAALILSM